MKLSRVSVVGLGKLGLCMATVFASRGIDVTGVDVDSARVESVNKGISPIFEPGLAALLSVNTKRLRATTEYNDAILSTDATFVVVPTPSDKKGAFSLRHVRRAMIDVGKALSKKGKYHLVVITSTILPLSMDRVVKPALEKYSHNESPAHYGLCYNPEFIALGDVIRGLLRPDFVLIGESDRKAGSLLSSFHSRVCTNSPPIERMNFVNAEIAKISLNSFITMKMSFANTLAEVCEKLPGGNVDTVTTAITRDKRVGVGYLKGALGYGGPCFPRDNVALAHFASRLGVSAALAEATHDINQKQIRRMIGVIEHQGLRPPARIGILGLTYKPNTNVVELSQSMGLAAALSAKGFHVSVYDPVANTAARNVLGSAVVFESSAQDCIAVSDLCVIATPWDEFARLRSPLFRGKTVLDCWRILEKHDIGSARYIPLGVGMN